MHSPAATLMSSLLQTTPDLLSQVEHLLVPMAADRDQIRTELVRTRSIHQMAEEVTPRTIAAVDGGSVLERLYAADFIAAVAAAADGRTPHPGWNATNKPTAWSGVVRHEPDTDQLRDAAMICQEASLLATLPHQLRVYDGSHVTMYFAIVAGLFSKSEQVAHTTATLTAQFGVPDAIRQIASYDETRWVVALPKSDSANEWTLTLEDSLGIRFPSGDRFLAAAVLERGEFLAPRPVTSLTDRELGLKSTDPDVIRAGQELKDATRELVAAGKDNRIHSMYTKPATSDTVIKVEFATPTGASRDTVLERAATLARLLSDETPGPHMLEPYCQYTVDRICKTVGPGSQAVRQAMLSAVAGQPYAHMLARNYRT